MLGWCLVSLENVFNSCSMNGCMFMNWVTLLTKSFAWLYLIGSISELTCWQCRVGSAHQKCHFWVWRQRILAGRCSFLSSTGMILLLCCLSLLRDRASLAMAVCWSGVRKDFVSIMGYWKWIRAEGRHFYQAQCFVCSKNACVMWLYLKWSTSVMHFILSKISGGDKVGICLKIQIKILFFQVRRFACLASLLPSVSLKQCICRALKEMVLVMYFGI